MTYDFVIVGGGSAGCVLANRLSKNTDHQVLLLEAGPGDDSALIRAPLGSVLLYISPKFNWRFWSQKENSLKNRNIYCPQGKTLGGSSAINGMVYARGNAWDYDNWENLGNKGWGYREMLKHFIACESNENFDDEYHGKDGGLNVQSPAKPYSHAERLLLAALQAGYPYNPDFNGRKQEGVGIYQFNIKNGRRFSAAHAFLDPVKDRSNLTIITDAEVHKVNFEENKAVGVTYQVGSITQTVVATKEVIISAGTFNSPKLLMLSGIGPKEELEKHGIGLLKDLPGVGRNLQEHVDIVIATKSKIADTFTLTLSGIFKITFALYRYLIGQSDIVSNSFSESGGFIKSNPSKEIPDIQLHSTPLLLNDHGFDMKILKEHGYSLHVTLLRPKSRGRVTLKSKCYSDHPLIQLNMLDDEEDVKDLANGLKLGREILGQDAYRRHRKEEIYPGEHIQEGEEIAEMLRSKACHVFHPVGTCKMGNDELSVVDERLCVHDIKNLRVIDASIMPHIVGGNINAPVMAIASKGAEMILETHAGG